MAKVLVVGGAGYVGSTVVAWLLDRGHEVTVLDNLTTGRRELLQGTAFIQANMGDQAALESLFSSEKFDCLFHFAAKTIVSESVSDPQGYFENNVNQSIKLLEAYLKGCRAHDVSPRVVFSSTCAVFGDPGKKDLTEDLPKNPMNPYGASKLECEQRIEKLCKEAGLQAIVLRYFNACGAEPKKRVGEWHIPETHLVPRLLQAARRDAPVELYGDDYPTEDGTCVRDYVHVWDLADAHGAAMQRLLTRESKAYRSIGQFEAYNLGSRNGFSVKQVIAATEKVTGKKLAVQVHDRRPGDPPRLVSGSKLAEKELGFRPRFINIEEIVRSAYEWDQVRLSRKAIFMDRDGTLNEDPGYLSDHNQMRLLPGVEQALKKFKEKGYLLVVVSNQSGVGRGKITPDQLVAVNQRLNELLELSGAKIDHFELCIHRPEEQCSCRKPQPKLLLDAAEKLGINLGASYMVGDKLSDLHAGDAAGCKQTFLVRTGEGKNTEKSLSPLENKKVCNTLLEVADFLT